MATGPRRDVAEMAQAQSQSQDLNIRRRTLLAAGLTAGTLVASGLLSPAATAADTGGVSAAVGSNGFAEAGLPVNRALGGGSAGTAWTDAPEGFAGVAAHGRAGTTGGAGGRLVHASTPDELRAFAKSTEPLVVILHGELVFPQYEKLTVTANKSFLGAGAGAAVVNAGFKLINVSNVVFRNFTVRDSYIPGRLRGETPGQRQGRDPDGHQYPRLGGPHVFHPPGRRPGGHPQGLRQRHAVLERLRGPQQGPGRRLDPERGHPADPAPQLDPEHPPAQRQPGQHRGVPRLQQLPGEHLQLRDAGAERSPAGGGGQLLPGCPESAPPPGPGR